MLMKLSHQVEEGILEATEAEMTNTLQGDAWNKV